MADFPENAITLCERSHSQIIHPDVRQAIRDYREGHKDSFNKMLKERDSKLEDQIVYWNTDFDRQMLAIAIRNTQKRTKEGWRYGKKT